MVCVLCTLPYQRTIHYLRCRLSHDFSRSSNFFFAWGQFFQSVACLYLFSIPRSHTQRGRVERIKEEKKGEATAFELEMRRRRRKKGDKWWPTWLRLKKPIDSNNERTNSVLLNHSRISYHHSTGYSRYSTALSLLTTPYLSGRDAIFHLKMLLVCGTPLFFLTKQSSLWANNVSPPPNLLFP